MAHQRQLIGALGEHLAAEYVSNAGLHILQRNWRNGRQGELDIIAADPFNNCYVVIEVRTRTGSQYGSGYVSVDWKKYSKLRKLAAQWLSLQSIRRHVRIDVISIDMPPAIYTELDRSFDELLPLCSQAEITWIQGISQ